MQQFKVKPVAKKSSTNVSSSNTIQNVSEKRLELCQNNDLINIQEMVSTEQTIGQSVDMVSRNPPTLLRNPSLRPKSGVSRPIGKTSKAKPQKSDQQMIQQRIRQKLMANTIDNRSSTSGMNQTSGLRYQKRQKLINRRTTTNSNNNLTGFSQKGNRTIVDHEGQGIRLSEQQHTDMISNEQVLSIIEQIIDGSGEYNKLREANEEQFQKIRQKLMSNVSIIVLKWYKIVQDRLFHEVKKLGAGKKEQQQGDANQGQQRDSTKNCEKIPETIEELIEQEVRKQFSVKNGLFAIEQRCSKQQNKLSMLIDGRLEKLQNLLAQSTARTMQRCA